MMGHRLKPSENIAVVCASGLGDALMFAILTYNLYRNGHRVTLYSTALQSLSAWFPHATISPFPPESERVHIFSQYDRVIAADHSVAEKIQMDLPQCFVLKKKFFNRKKTVVDNLVNFCKNALHLKNITNKNGITLPSPYDRLAFRQYPARVVIHPESADSAKNWSPDKFIQLARRLKKINLTPVFVVAPHECDKWLKRLNDEFELPLFTTLNNTAIFIYESGWMIGNDSGIGHLASNLGLPTLSIFRVKTKAWHWRPGWKNNQFVTPFWRIPGPQLRCLWKKFLSVNRVFRAFQKLTHQCSLSTDKSH